MIRGRIVFVVTVVAALFAAAAVSAASVSGTAQPRTKIVVAVSANYPALAQANKQRVFSNAGLTVTLIPMASAKGVVQAVASGKAMFGVTDAGVGMWQATLTSLPLQIVSGVTAYKAKTSAMLVGAGVADAAALYGGKVGIPEWGSVFHLAANVWLDSNGADTNNVTFSRILPAKIAGAVAAGTVNGAVAPPGYVKGKSIGDPVGESYGVGAPLAVAFATQTTATAKRALVRSFIGALAKVPGTTTKIDMDALELEAQTLNDYAFLDSTPDLATIVWRGAPKQ